MRKSFRSTLCVFRILGALVFVGIVALVIGVFNYKNHTAENTQVIEAEVTDVRFVETNTKAVVYISMGNGSNELYLQDDTVIKDGQGKLLSFANLEAGQRIRAEVDPTVLYDARMVETPEGTIYESVDIYSRCYEVVILE